ncbi:hypothetical protein lacNasYZ03_08300 [Lactobacillus nasalidis]|uniref:Acyltransferase n=1 Tax=Lactobacillus nasalidis TaxID=2797258 RepID=A0ABQ3W3V6_9LACO|nr:hypothetical protein [Lactobacillus nasalidis]GHV97739.1 hypothetical protein lacNasYZ01_09210 [Lactobacillus nasalidis]GHV98945.1 hypothetical protein lacNasYZ02_03750 [Lactobacillus nasalidis]GHW01143.1 hypothetical protein lacNasYZ03_08300 [Lactobacillus nasalidis]
MKKHLIFLGDAGVIYYSWLLLVLFLTVIFCLEGSQFVNLPTLITGFIFLILAFFTWSRSYISFGRKTRLRLPYRKELVLEWEPKLVTSWRCFEVYRARISKHQSIDYLVLKGKRDNNG